MNRALLEVSGPIHLWNSGIVIKEFTPLVSILTTVVVLLLADCYVSITEYYIQRIRMVVYRDLTQQVLDEDMKSTQDLDDPH